jgi:hypothetical protein
MNKPFINLPSLLNKTQNLLRQTPSQVAIGALLVGGASGSATYIAQSQRRGNIPVAFSEAGQISRHFKAMGQEMPPLTTFYARTNDLLMQIFEANDIAYFGNTSNEAFARQLLTRIDPALRRHRQIPEYIRETPAITQQAYQSLSNLVDAEKELAKIASALNNSWDESHIDTDIPVPSTSCDTKGNCTTTINWVYEYTTHSYTYYPEQGQYAAHLLNNFIARYPDLYVREKLVTANAVGQDNESAMAFSMHNVLKDGYLSPEKALMFAKKWATGSNFTKFTPTIYSSYAAIQNLAPTWNSDAYTASSTSYITYSHSDSGPTTYQHAQYARHYAADVVDSSLKITQGMQTVADNAPVLEEKVREFIAVTLDHKPGNANRLRGEVLSSAQRMYQKNYADGFDVQPIKPLLIALFALAGSVIGGASIYGARRLLSARQKRATHGYEMQHFRY